MAAEIESQPLLVPDFESAGERQFPALSTPIHYRLPTRSAWRKHLRFYILIFSLQFVTNFGFYLSDLPLVRLFERQICQGHHGSTDEIPEAMCKSPAIQDKLAYILELKNALDALPGSSSFVKACSRLILLIRPLPIIMVRVLSQQVRQEANHSLELCWRDPLLGVDIAHL